MKNIRFIKSQLLKSHLYLKFEGTCGYGSEGNKDVDFIIKVCKEQVCKYKYTQGIIFDFKDLEYEFGNRFLNLFKQNSIVNNRTFIISIIPNVNNLISWKTLFEFGNLEMDFYGNENSVFQNDINGALKSINKRFNN